MPETTTMTVRLDKEVKAQLERLAQSTRRSKSYLASEAIAEYVAVNAWQMEQIGKAIAKAGAGGPFVRHEDATRYLDALGRGESPEPPATGDSPGRNGVRSAMAGAKLRARVAILRRHQNHVRSQRLAPPPPAISSCLVNYPRQRPVDAG